MRGWKAGSVAAVLLHCVVGAPALAQQAVPDTTAPTPTASRHAMFKDPQDGHFDMSRWLLDRK